MGKGKVKRDRGVLVSSLIGALICLAALAVLSVVGGVIIYMLDDPLALIDIGSLVCLLLSGVVSSFIIAKRTPEKKLIVTMLSALLFSLVMLIIGAAWGMGSLGWRVVLNYVCYMGMALVGAWLGTRERKRRRR